MPLSGYVIGERLYSSDVTQVVRAVRERDGKKVVLKYPTSAHPSLGEIARYRREQELLTAAPADVVVPLVELARFDDRDVLVTEDTSSVTLLQFFEHKPAPIAGLLRVAVSFAEALAKLHAAGIVHKDVNPSNVVIQPQTGALQLIDLGISTRLTREAQGLAHPSLLEGTLAFMSPEQTGRVNCAVDARSDLYSTGVMLYALLAGKPPFEGGDALALIHAHIALEPAPLAELRPQVPALLSRVVTKLMAKSADDRYQSAAGLLFDLRKIQDAYALPGAVKDFALGEGDAGGRFEIPHALYGRERETHTLLTSFERAAQGNAGLLLVAGYSGIGKSTLVSALQKSIVARRGYFAAGKFDQYNRNVPYSAVSAAFRELIHYLLMEPPQRVESWRSAVLEAVGKDGRVLLDVIPALELLIGEQAPVAQVSPAEAKNRFDNTFRAFLGTLAAPEHPLVVFLDDLQWADTPSLHLLEAVLSESKGRSLFVIGAYRDNEVDAAHPALLMADAVRKAGTAVEKIALGPLAANDTLRLIADTLHVTHDAATPLAELLHNRTGGNPFFLVQLLQSLEQSDQFRLSADRHSWTWDLDQIRARGLTDNVVDLMAARMRHLPIATRQVLCVAACIGNHFDLNLLSIVLGRDALLIDGLLWPALAAELIVATSSGKRRGEIRSHFTFLHDRVQQAAYALLSEAERTEQHLKIGWLMFEQLPPEQLDRLLFDVVGHLNLGVSLVHDPEQRARLIELNVRAARRAKVASAHKAAADSFRVALQLLGPNAWASDYQLMFDVHRELADCEYVNGNFEASEQLALHAIEHCNSVLDKANLYTIRMYMAITAVNYPKAMSLGLEILSSLGYEASADAAGAARARAEVGARLERELAGVQDIQALAVLPEMQNPETRASMKILSDVWCATYFSGLTTLSSWAIDLMTYLSITQGPSAESAFSYMVYGVNLTVTGHPRRGYEFGKLGLRVNERLPNLTISLLAGNMFAHSINPYFNKYDTNIKLYKRSYEIGPQVGELIYTVWAVLCLMLCKVIKGDPLETVYEESTSYLKFVRSTNDLAILNVYQVELQMIRALQGKTAGRNSLNEADYDEQAAVQRMVDGNFWPGLLFYGAYRAGLHVVFRDFEAALQACKLAEQGLPYDVNLWTTTNHFFYQSLALAGLYADTPVHERQALLTQMSANLARIESWADTCPDNFAHRRDLVAAELARCQGEHARAARLYEQSFEAAKAGHFHNDAALAAELAAYFHRASGSVIAARAYLDEALYAYTRWGANGKAEELRRQHPELERVLHHPAALGSTVQSTSDNPNHTTALANAGSVLDFRTAMKAAQALSAEVARHALIDKLLHLALENAGGRAVWLVLSRGEELELIASAAVGSAAATAAQGSARALDSDPDLPQAVVRFTARTREPVVLRDAARDGRFVNDPVIKRRACRSIAAVPLLQQGRLTGVLYLENNLVEGAFSESRMEMLQLLAAQATISLENAALYADLEARVEARTRALDAQNVRMRTVLDNVGQGFILASRAGIMEPQHSRILERWFGVPERDSTVWSFLFSHSEDEASYMCFGWEQLTGGVLAVEMCLEQLPRQIQKDGRTYDVAYRPIGAGNSFERVVLVVTDVTASLAAEQAEARRQELADVLHQALGDRVGFREMVHECKRSIAELSGEHSAPLRAIHTLKGNSALWQLRTVVQVCHRIENEVALGDALLTSTQKKEIVSAWAESAGKLEQLLLKSASDYSIRVSDYDALLAALDNRKPHDELRTLLRSWMKEPLADRFMRFGTAAQALAQRLDKGQLDVHVDAGELRAAPDQLGELWASFTHLIRNAVDHGIETPAERRSAGKSPRATLTFRAYADGSDIVIEVSDDGRGIDWDAVARKAKKLGLPTATAEDLKWAIFAEGMSTKDAATEHSGRGIGLAAVRAAVDALRGTLDVSTTLGQGATIRVRLARDYFVKVAGPSWTAERSQRPSQVPPVF
jgi:histidine kinase